MKFSTSFLAAVLPLLAASASASPILPPSGTWLERLRSPMFQCSGLPGVCPGTGPRWNDRLPTGTLHQRSESSKLASALSDYFARSPWALNCAAVGGCGPNRLKPGYLARRQRSVVSDWDGDEEVKTAMLKALAKTIKAGDKTPDPNPLVRVPSFNAVDEMTNMISAQRAYEANNKVMNTANNMLQKVLELGKRGYYYENDDESEVKTAMLKALLKNVKPEDLKAPGPNPLVRVPSFNAVDEMAKLVSSQRAYEASNKVMNTADNMLQKLVGLGKRGYYYEDDGEEKVANFLKLAKLAGKEAQEAQEAAARLAQQMAAQDFANKALKKAMENAKSYI